MNDTTKSSSSNDQLQIRDLIARWAKAVREQDLAGIRADHEPDILMFDVPPPFMSKGLEAYMATWNTFFAWSDKPVVFDFDQVEVAAGQDVAFATAVGRCSGTEKNGENIKLEFRLTLGLRKRDGRWRVAHEHHSLPATN